MIDKKIFRKVVKKAKREFFRKIVDGVDNAKGAFDVTKWHKSKGIFRKPPLIDPLFPDNPPAQTPEEKREVLARNLLRNLAEVDDR